MDITYVLLSPTFGMHQYTADLANRAATGRWLLDIGSRKPDTRNASHPYRTSDNQRPHARLVTTMTLPRDRYSPAVDLRTPITTRGTGFAVEGLNLAAYHRVLTAITRRPSAIVHFTGVHAWNVPLVYALRRRAFPVIHTLHDLDPHTGARFPALIRLWNRLIIASGCHLLVHGRQSRDQLMAQGIPRERISYTPLLHGFLAADRPWPPAMTDLMAERNAQRKVNVLFFGRVEAYKGVEDLLAAWGALAQAGNLRRSGEARLIIAGPVGHKVTLGKLPPDVELRDRWIDDAEADALFRAASLLVLPYRDATQSALIAAAYAYGLPVLVTRTGALPESVIEEETGRTVPPGDPATLSAALTAALAAPLRLARMGEAGRAWFETRRREEELILANMYQCLLS